MVKLTRYLYKHDYGRFESILLASQITDVGKEMGG